MEINIGEVDEGEERCLNRALRDKIENGEI